MRFSCFLNTSDTIYRKSVQSSPPQQQASSNQSEDTSPSSSPAKSNRKRNPRISEPPPWRHDTQGGESEGAWLNTSTAPVSLAKWLKYNCSPEYLLEEKWHRSFRERQIILQQKGLEYINEFPCLRAPGGYKLLADDFAIIHPDAHNRFTQKYGGIKSKILSRLHDHHSDKARNLIDLATVGEDEADVATFQAITYLLRRMHTFSVQGAKKKTVNPSRDQVVFVLLREPNMSKVSRNSSSHSLLLSALPGGKSNNMTSS
ncbi:hypothetical protein M8J77_005538 [Diaphorina citri]|nr:hypothetical protein M8J77_005538 [Diaphorina citri]